MKPLTFGTFCSGICAPEVAWRGLGWVPLFVSEIDPFAVAVEAHHFPDVPQLGDMEKIDDETLSRFRPDLVCAGTPCQAFSVAGLRKGLDDPRGNLTLVFLRLLDRLRPRWVVWENVPGVFSSGGGRDFAAFISGLVRWEVPIPDGGWRNSGVVNPAPVDGAYGVAWRVLDAQHFGVPQRRRRVFVVGHLGDWRRAAAVLFERHSLSGDSPPCRETREGVAGTFAARPSGGGGFGTDFDADGGLIAPAVTSKWAKGTGGPSGDECQNLVTHALSSEGADASEDGTGRGTPIVPVAFDTTQITSAANRSNPKPGDPCHPLARGAHPPAIAFGWNKSPAQSMAVSDVTDPVRASHTSNPAVAFQCQGSNVGPMGTLRKGNGNETGGVPFTFQTRVARNDRGGPSETTGALTSCEGGTHADTKPHVASAGGVRRLTPRECERLQGFEDDWTLIPVGGKPAADSPRYRAIGNSMAVPVMRWIGERIAMVDAIPAADESEVVA